MYRAFLTMSMYIHLIIGQAYTTDACTTGTSGMTPKSSEMGDTLTVMLVLYKVIEILPTTGESVHESVSILVCEYNEDDDDIRRKLKASKIFLLSPSFLTSFSFHDLLWFKRWRARLCVFCI